MTLALSLREALADDQLLGSALVGPSWDNWKVLLLACMGEPLTDDELAVYRRFTGRQQAPSAPVEEATFVIGRRGGKDRAASLLAAYLSAFRDYSTVLAKGERGVCLCIGPDQRQSAITRNYIEGVFEGSPVLANMIASRTADTIELVNGVAIEVRAASFRRLRGATAIAVVATEACFWRSDENAANTDIEILNATRPSLLTTGGPTIIISSPYAKRGVVWENFKRNYGNDTDPLVLVAKGTSRDFNPTLPQALIGRALERDHAAASAEYLAEFRSDLEDFVSEEVVRACVEPGITERPPLPGRYVAFCDPSGGSIDSAALGIAHRHGDHVVIDLVHEIRAPHSPEKAVAEFAALLREYKIDEVHGDHYAGQWPREAYERHNIRYYVSDRPKAVLYQNLLPALNSQKITLPDDPTLTAQLTSLERRVGRGRDSIDHPPNGRDDVANVVAGANHVAKTAFGSVATFATYGTPTAPLSALRREAETWSAPCTLKFDQPRTGQGFTTVTRWKN